MFLNVFYNIEKEERIYYIFLERKYDIIMKIFERQFNNKEKIIIDRFNYEYLYIFKKVKKSKYMFVLIDVKQEFLKF